MHCVSCRSPRLIEGCQTLVRSNMRFQITTSPLYKCEECGVYSEPFWDRRLECITPLPNLGSGKQAVLMREFAEKGSDRLIPRDGKRNPSMGVVTIHVNDTLDTQRRAKL